MIFFDNNNFYHLHNNIKKMSSTQRDSLVYSYILATDVGASPCVENDCLTISICKPKLRQKAQVSDIIVGISGYKLGKNKRIMFISKITKIITMKKYGEDEYNNRSDSIFTSELKMKKNDFHNVKDDRDRDISGKNVLISTDFIYFGENHIVLPENLQGIIPGRGYQSDKNTPFKSTLIDLFTSEKNIKTGKRGNYSDKIKKKCSPHQIKC